MPLTAPLSVKALLEELVHVWGFPKTTLALIVWRAAPLATVTPPAPIESVPLPRVIAGLLEVKFRLLTD